MKEKMMKPKFPEVVVQLTGSDGNAFAVMGAVAAAMRDAGFDAYSIQQYRDDAMSGDYDNLLEVTMDWVTVE